MNRYLPHYILAAVVILATAGFLLLLVYHPVPAENKDAVMLALGALFSAFGTVIGYFFGSSKGSADKTDVLADLNSKLGAGATGNTEFFKKPPA